MDSKKLFIFLLLGIFLISFASAFDNSLQTGLIRYYQFNETSGTTAVDSTQIANGTINASTTLGITGKINNAYNFTPTNSLVTMGAKVTVTSLNFWVFPQNNSPSKTLFYNVADNHAIYMEVGGYLRIFRNPSDLNTTIKAPLNQWSMITFRHNGTGYLVSVNNGTEAYIVVSELMLNEIGGRSNGGTQNYNGAMDELGFWNKTLSLDERNTLYNDSNGFRYDTTNPSVTLSNPTTGSTLLVNTATVFNWTSSTTSGSLTNTSIYINGILNETVNISGTSNLTSVSKAFSQTGNYNWTVQSCITNSCQNSTTSTFSVRYYTIDSVSYSTSLYETSIGSFQINLTYLSSLASIDMILEYNGTNYTTTNSGSGDDGVFTTSLDIPVMNISTNVSFFWWVQSTGDTTEISTSSTYTQTINPIILTLCNATYTNVGLNFTYYNELTGSKINVTASPQTFQGTFNYWVGSGNIYKNYSIDNINTTNSSYAFCINPFNDSSNQIKVSSNIYYTANGYSSGNYYLNNASLYNTTSNLTLWLLPSSSATQFTITTYRGVSTLDNAYVTVSKFFEGEGIYKTVAMARTDSSGVFVVDLQLNKLYSFSYVKEGVSYGTVYKTATCSSTPCELDIQLTQDTYDLFSGYYDTYAQNVAYNLYYNNTLKTVYASFNDLTGLAVYFRLVVLPSSLNDTQTAVCDVYSYSTSGTLTCNMTGYTGDYVAKLYISRSPEKLVHLIGFVANTLQENIGTVALLISLIFLIIIVFSGMRNPTIAVALVPLALVVLKLIDFNPLSWLTIAVITFIAILLIGRLKT